MKEFDYDVVAIGGGLGGTALGKTLAERGYRVLVLERTTAFTDRVRGEVLVPWGAAEAEKLGLQGVFDGVGGHELRFWDAEINGFKFLHRDLVETLPTARPVLTFFHPDMQERIAACAVRSGADVRRGALVKSVEPGHPTRVTYAFEGNVVSTSTRLAVAADGRSSAARKWGGFPVERARQRRFFAGVLMDGMAAPEDTMYSRFNPSAGLMSWIFPQGAGRSRNYIGFPAESGFARFQGEKDVARFIETSIELGVPEEAFANASAVGPLATFDATDNWVPHPYRDGLALIGDAAATSDPTWGQGMSQTLLDVRILADALAEHDDWNSAGHAYAEEHDRATRTVRDADTWYTDVMLDVGAEADARRERALPLIAQDISRIPDVPLAGPYSAVADETARQRFFGEI